MSSVTCYDVYSGCQLHTNKNKAAIFRSLSILLAFVLDNLKNPEIIDYFQEGLIGIVIGISINVLFRSIHIAGMIIGMQSGLSQATFFNPSNSDQENIITKFLILLVITLMFSTNTYMIIIASIVNSYNFFPPIIEIEKYADVIVNSISNGFELAVKTSLPVVIICTLIYFASGIIGKLIPYIQVFFIVIPLQICIGMIIIFLTISGLIIWFIENYNMLITDFY
ncbi:MAG: flagellar biosynthetic protein FliR [Rickettsiaceae bacterium H1]|nr:flagellar biosynthetic protein FliR [Rickettsiaceae bacterium H1]